MYTNPVSAAQQRTDDLIPVGFDPAAFPIIAEHFFGLRPVGQIAAVVVNDLAFRRRIHALEPRAIEGGRP